MMIKESENKIRLVDDVVTRSKLDWRLLFIRFFVAFVLLIATLFKAYQLSTTPIIGVGIFHARWFNTFVVEFELFFGLWLIFGFLPKFMRFLAKRLAVVLDWLKSIP
jgi:uncharacterized membrane protein YphA (DoxX/SURF4 family)